MKTTDEMIQRVFERKNRYESDRKARIRKLRKGLPVVCCVCMVLTLFVVAATQQQDTAPAGTYRILIDVNPSIELCANGQDVVVEATALNSDGAGVLKEAEVEGKSVVDAMKALSDTMVDQGYISEEANSVLVSIEGVAGDREQNIKSDLAESISQSLAGKAVEGSIIVQTLAEDSERNQLAGTYGISSGKAHLINQIIAHNKFHTFEELSAMSIHELNVLKVSYYVEMEGAEEVGAPGYMAFIGQDAANEAALQDAGIAGDAVETRLDCAAGTMVYCVEFEDTIYEYRYYVNAVTGEVLSGDKKELGEDQFPTSETDGGFIGENAALNAALAHAGMADSVLTWCKQDRDWVNGMAVYNIFFTDGRFSGRYVVNARTGEIIQNSKTQEPKDRSVNANVIGESAAKRIALAKDGLIDGNVSKYESKLQAENGSYTYTLVFICNGVRYNVQIDAVSGTILQFEKNGLKDTGAPSVEDGTPAANESGNAFEE